MKTLATVSVFVFLLDLLLGITPLVPIMAPPALLAQGGDCAVLENFSGSKVGEFPEGWKPRKDSGKAAYTVREDGGVRFLRAAAKNLGIQAAKEKSWDLGQHPVLAWKWRPREFPKGANEQSGKNDSVLSVYAVFPHTKFSVKTVKYIWSEKVPVGTHLESSQGLTQAVVLRSGPPANRDAWVEDKGNVAQDYKKFFGEDAPKPIGIAVLTDSDDTKSYAEGDYAAFRLCK
jgi:hypothetical protein